MLLADNNFAALKENTYPGRGIIVGLDATGENLVQVYWIMGRSANSRNRIFSSSGGRVWTEAADPAQMADPSLIIYNAMRELDRLYVVTNGDQTDTIVQALRGGATFQQALMTRQYEPDAPNHTPRISAICSLKMGLPMAELSVLKHSPLSNACDRFFYVYDDFVPGYGRFVSTYERDETPLPSFEGEPRLMPLRGEMNDIAEEYWAALNEENRVSLAVKFIGLADGISQTRIINQYAK